MSTCERYDDACQWPAFGERLSDTVFITYPFINWANIVLTAFIVFVVYGSGVYFSIPFRYYNKATKGIRKKEKAAENARKQNRIAVRKQRRMNRLKGVMKKIVSINKVVSKQKAGLLDVAAAAKAERDRAKSVEEKRVAVATVSADAVVAPAPAGVELVSLNLAPDGSEREDSPLLRDYTPTWRGIDYELVDADNKAFSISYSGFVLALCIVLSGPRMLNDPSDDPLTSCYETLVWSLIGVFLLSLNYFIQNKILLFGLYNQKELLKGNLCVGITEAGAFIATSLNVRAVLSGPGRGFAESVAAAALFFTLGQACMILFSVLFQLLTPYDDQAEARKGNAAAGIRFASNLIALALLTSTPLKKSEEVATFFLFFGLAAIFLFLFGQLLDRLILPGNINKEIEDDRNWGMPLISGVILIVTAFMLDTLLPDIPCPGTPARNAYEAYFRQLP